jgi:hypothetical protein
MTRDEAVERVIALTELSKATGTQTTRTINQLLQGLPGPLLMDVAVELKRRGWTRGRTPALEVLSGQSQAK